MKSNSHFHRDLNTGLLAVSPTMAPTVRPISTAAPTAAVKTSAPTSETSSPTRSLTQSPTKSPVVTNMPTMDKTTTPTSRPSAESTSSPTGSPTHSPTTVSTEAPAAPPTSVPTILQTRNPTAVPTTAPSQAKTSTPTTAPSSAPTQKCNLSESARAGLISIFVRAISNAADVDTPGTPQNLAAEWLINLDTYYMCPQDPNLIQRYVMAVFYYSTRGDRWTQCSAPLDFKDPAAIDAANARCTIVVPNGNSSAWLTPDSVCQWGGLACDEDELVNRIDFGKYGDESLEYLSLLEISDLRNNLCRAKWYRRYPTI